MCHAASPGDRTIKKGHKGRAGSTTLRPLGTLHDYWPHDDLGCILQCLCWARFCVLHVCSSTQSKTRDHQGSLKRRKQLSVGFRRRNEQEELCLAPLYSPGHNAKGALLSPIRPTRDRRSRGATDLLGRLVLFLVIWLVLLVGGVVLLQLDVHELRWLRKDKDRKN